MLRTWVIALLLCLAALPSAAQKKQDKGISPLAPPGTKVITSFDRDHNVVGWLEIFPFESKILHNTRMIRVLVPANYLSPHNAHRAYPVLYMQDGQNLFDEATSTGHGEWQMDDTVEHLVGAFKVPPMFVIGIDSAGEKSAPEYLPYPDPENTEDKDAASEKAIQGKEYARFLMTELIPFIQAHYRISRGTLNTGLGGSSYGADIALYTALTYPGTFGHLLLESPILNVGDGQLLKDAEKAKLLPQRMYIGVGTSESLKGDPKQAAERVQNVEELEKILRKKGMTPNRLKVVIEEGGEHNEGAWSRRLPDAMLFLYGQ
jgi:predicted alpha/beta superfamily hydrolase